ncbi:unnamed protein product [Closterium sp. NIES-54]
MASWRSTGTYVDAVSPPRANVVDGMWIFKVKRPPGSPPVLKARYVVRGFIQHERFDFFQTFAPTPKMTTLRVLLHIAAHRDYERHSLEFSRAAYMTTGRRRPVHWTAAVMVAKYLATTSGVGLVLGGTQQVVLTGHCDSLYANNVETQRSIQGYFFSLDAGAVSWRSTRPSSVA